MDRDFACKYFFVVMFLLSWIAVCFGIPVTSSARLPNLNETPRASDQPALERETVEDYVDINSKVRKTEILHQLMEVSKYDFRLRPSGQNGSGPVHVFISAQVKNVENVDDIEMEYTVQMVLRQQWTDSRLKYSHIQNNVKYLQLDDSSKIWKPDVFFSNEKTGIEHKLMQPNVFVRVSPDGLVLMSSRITLILSCEMELQYYPMDKQSCPIAMSLYGWTTSDVTLSWRTKNAVELKLGIRMPHFELESIKHGICLTSVSSSGNYSCIDLTLDFSRQFGYYLIQIYVPCGMLVIVSWVSFWLEPKATEARISLCVTTILTVVTQAYGINQSVPPASYIKAIDVWTFTVQLMVFASILQYSYVNYLSRFAWKKIIKEMKISNTQLREKEEERLQIEGEKNAKRVDNISKIVFPAFFALFNIVYWSVYMVLRNSKTKPSTDEIFVNGSTVVN